MTLYMWVKLVHIVSATVLFGTGMGIAYFMLKAYRSDNQAAIVETSKHVVIADWLFTAPAVIVQLVSGVWLTWKLGIAFDSSWFLAVMGLYIFVGACWIPVVWIQIRIRDLVQAGAGRDEYKSMMKIWVVLGALAFSSVLVLIFLMVAKYGAYD